MTTLRGAVFDPSDARGATLAGLLARCRARQAAFAIVPLDAIERALGAPDMATRIGPPPRNAVELGLLELEEEVLQEEYDMVRATLIERRRTWQQSAELDAAAAIGRQWREAGVPIRFVTCKPADADFAARIATALEAEGIVVSA